jgi:hypothetical protein
MKHPPTTIITKIRQIRLPFARLADVQRAEKVKAERRDKAAEKRQ